MLEIYDGNKVNDKDKGIDEEYTNTTKKLDKCLEIVASVGMATAISSLVTMFLGPDEGQESLFAMTGATVLLSPPIYFGMKKLKEKIEERTSRDMHQAGQLVLMYQEVGDHDRRIESMTSLFLDEIFTKFEEENISLPQDQLININQFLYLVNANYYEKIEANLSDMSRDKLINKMLDAISIYLIDSEREAFDEKDALRVLFYCPFISEELKSEIAKEFKKSKVTVSGTTVYEIVRNDILGSIEEFKQRKDEEDKGRYKGFDIEDSSDYHELILSYVEDPRYTEKGYRDPRDIDWDVGFLKKVVNVIVRDYREELLEANDYYSNYNLTSSLVSNALMYALVNNKDMVDPDVILSTFKTWDYIPFQTKLSVIDTLFIEEDIDFSSHPFSVSKSKKKGEKQVTKIIQFKPKGTIESE